MFHLTNVGPNAMWKIEKVREKFPDLPLVHRDYPISQEEMGDDTGYDEGCAILVNLHSIGFSRQLTDQEMYEVWTFWFNLRK